MTTPHDYYGPDGYPHLHSKGNSAITADPDWLANEHGDMLPLGSTLGIGPQGDGVIALVKESDDVKGTFILQFLNDKTLETFLESPNLHAGILSARTDDSKHTLYIDLMRKGFNKQIAEMVLPEGEQGTRLYLHKTSVPVEIFSDDPEDLEYTFNAEDLFYRGTSRTDTEEEAPRVNDTVVSCIVWRNTKEDGTREDLAYLAVGMVQAVTNDKDEVGEPITNVHVIFRTLYMMNAQLQSDFAQEDPNEVDFIKHREWIEDKKNKVTSLLSEPINDEQYPNAKAVYRELAALKDATVIAAVVDTHEEMLNLPMSALTNKDIIMVLHDNSERIEEEKRGGTAYWKYTLLDKNKKNYKTIPESKLKLLSVLPPYATELELQEEIKRAEAAEKALQDALDTETKARSDADDVLTKAIESEVKQRQDADKVLDKSKSPRLNEGANIHLKLEDDGTLTISADGGTGDVTKEYVDEADKRVLSSAKGYTDSALEAYTKTEQIQTWLNNKVEKLNTANRVYTTNDAGADTSRALVTSPTANGIPCYSASKTLPTATPVNDTDAATKKYVDDSIASKLDKLPTGQTAQVYARNSSGSEVGIGYSANPGTGSMLALFDTSGNLRTGTPTSNTQATNKQYVDNAVNPINDRLVGITAKEFIFTLEDGTTEIYYIDTESPVLKSKNMKGEK